MATSPPAVRAAATRAARLLRVRWLVRAPVWAAMARILPCDLARTALAACAAACPRAWTTLKPAPEKTLGTEAGDLPTVALDLVPRAAAPAA